MGKYVENNLNRGETVVKSARLSICPLVVKWVWACVFAVALLVIANMALVELIDTYAYVILILALSPIWKAIKATIIYLNIELAITGKRVIGKTGVINTQAMDTPLDKVQNVKVSSGLFGKIFHYGKITISLASLDDYHFDFVVDPDTFKKALMQQIEQYEADKINEQAQRTAQAMAQAQSQINNGQ